MRVYLMYVDENGDAGLNSSPADHLVLNGVVVHQFRLDSQP